MNEFPPEILLCTNGSPHGQPALDYGAWLASLLRSPVHVLGIVERPRSRNDVERCVARVESRLAESGVAIRKSVIDGNAQAVIPAHASAEGVLAVLGHLGRPLLRRLARGSSFRDLLAAIVSPILYVPVSRVPLRRLLICSGGLPYATSLEQFAIRLAKAARASITLLHVVEPVAYDYPLAREVESHWRSLLETDTPQGHNLIAAKQEAETQGVPLDVEVRRGSPVREILTQARRGDYDLLGLGSPHSAHSLRHLFMPNVTAEVAEAARCPVLAVRYSAPTGEPTVP